MPITKLPEMVACARAVLVSSESRARDAVLTMTLCTGEGDRYMLPLSERAMTQLTEITTGWRRTLERRCFNDGDASKLAAAAKIKPPRARYSLRNFGSAHHRRAVPSLRRSWSIPGTHRSLVSVAKWVDLADNCSVMPMNWA
jgi:hypothetical protein